MNPTSVIKIGMVQAADSVYDFYLLAILSDAVTEKPYILTADERPLVESVLRMCAAKVARLLPSCLYVRSFSRPDHELLSVEVPADLVFKIEFQLHMALTNFALAFILGYDKSAASRYNEMAEENIDIIRALTDTLPSILPCVL